MSSLRVLAVGNNCNVMLYAWRIQQSKSVKLVHVGGAESGDITIETSQYGNERFQFPCHYSDAKQLVSGGQVETFDLIIMSAASLQEMSSLAAQLNPVLTPNTKILVESTGFVHLEPFVKMSIEFSQLKVFSVMTDIDFRQVGPGHYRQYNAHGPNTFYLGESGVKSSVSSSSGGKYPKESITLLETFKRLFMKLFPQDQVDDCNHSYLDFLSQQWKLALPRVCFDPLLILLENSKPQELNDQILAKPLISGLVTEIITVTKTMGAKLPAGFDNENDLLIHWLKTNGNEIPQLAFHFLRRTAPLNIDMLLLQPILLADDYGIKTPYLEFLYSMMCQYQKLNNGESKWFCRSDVPTELRHKVSKLEKESGDLKSALKAAHDALEGTKRHYADEFTAKAEQENHMKSEIANLQRHIAKLSSDLKEEQEKAAVANSPYQQFQKEQTPVNAIPSEPNYTTTGTPIIQGLEDLAAYGVQFNATPPHSKPDAKSPEILAAAPEDPPTSKDESQTVLRERELELRKKELELQEKELELQRRAAARPRPTKFHSGPPSTMPHMQGIPNGHVARKPSVPQLTGRNNRQMHGAAPVVASGLVDPVSSLHNGTSTASMIQQPMHMPGGAHVHHPHQFKTTSRKNRRSNMPNLRHASSVDVLSMSGSGTAPPGAPNLSGVSNSGTKLNSMVGSGPSPAVLNRFQNGSGLQMNNLTSAHAPVSSSGSAAGGPAIQQRQVSTSTVIAEAHPHANTSTQSVLHNPVAQIVVNGTSSGSSISNGSTPLMTVNDNANVTHPPALSMTQPGEIANGQTNGYSNGYSNGHSSGHSNGHSDDQGNDGGASPSSEFEISSADTGRKKSKFGLFGKKDKKDKKKKGKK
ncbi:LAQU0S16e01002g1_1 [Lachancea quebecensis]|uniref:LAQU0S16e01002g1_1 n=1 Tax=Lachancea quebecensis TaxID=1654605 RepID=A0A0P1KWK8_9SACH|nr:LAQU0S16e01002g1_1 [Lachancea quebecensis]